MTPTDVEWRRNQRGVESGRAAWLCERTPGGLGQMGCRLVLAKSGDSKEKGCAAVTGNGLGEGKGSPLFLSCKIVKGDDISAVSNEILFFGQHNLK